MTSLAILHRDEILTGLRAGKRLRQIAAEIGYSTHSHISEALRDDPEYQAAIEDLLEQRLDNAEDVLISAAADGDQARANCGKALWQSATWRAERECPRRWGGQQQAAVQVSISPDHLATLAQRLVALAPGRLQAPAIDGQAEIVSADPAAPDVAP